MGRKQASGIGAEPEEGRMAEGGDASKARQQIERHGKQAADQDL